VRRREREVEKRSRALIHMAVCTMHRSPLSVGSVRRTIAALGIPSFDREDLLSSMRGHFDVGFFRNDHALTVGFDFGGVAAIVAELTPTSNDVVVRIARAIASSDAPPRLVLLTELSNSTASAVVAIHRWVPDVGVSLRGFDSLGDSVSEILSMDREDQPALEVMARCVSLVTPVGLEILAGAALVARRTRAITSLADVCRLSPRTVEQRLGDAGLMGPKRLLLWLGSLHALWQLERLHWSPKRIAVAAGFRSPQALSNCVERATGLRLAGLSAKLGFEGGLREFADRVHVA